MKMGKSKSICFGVAALFAWVMLQAGNVLASPPSTIASITNPDNRHNMSKNAKGPIRSAPNEDGTDQICIFCHTPHSAAPEGPLWSRPDPATTTFDLYGGASGELAIKGNVSGRENPGVTALTQYTNADPSTYPSGASRLCLSCHDGVTAVNVLRDGTTIAMVGEVTMPAQTTIDLSTAHPISFVYSDEVVTSVINVALGTVAVPEPYVMPSHFDSRVDTPLDRASRMQCTTCHDPHIDRSLDNGSLPPFWRQTSTVVDDPVTDVCNNCHRGPAFSSPTPLAHP